MDALEFHAIWDISTHSLTRRLTFLLAFNPLIDVHFNSQPHEEADSLSGSPPIAAIISTHSLTRRLTHFRDHRQLLLLFQLTASRGG